MTGQVCFGGVPYQPDEVDPLEEPWRWRTYPELSGLGAQCLAEGRDGAIWFGLVDGAWSYDGFDWVNHSSREGLSGSVATFCQGPGDEMFAGGRWGIERFANRNWIREFPPSGRRFGEVRKLVFAHDGSLWAATAWGALRIRRSGECILYTDAEGAALATREKGAPFVRIELLPAAVTGRPSDGASPVRRHDFVDVREDGQRRIWLGTGGGEILCYAPASESDGGDWALFNQADGLVRGKGPRILPLYDGSIWVVYESGSGHANVWADGTWRAVNLADAGVPGDCGDLIQTRDGAIWLSGRYVVSIFHRGRWRTYEKPRFPIPSARNFLMESSDGAVWIGGPGTVVQRIDYGTRAWLTLRDLNFQWESPEGVEWFLHRDGSVVAHESAGQWTRHGVEDGLIDAPVALLGTRTGVVWAAGSHGGAAATARFENGKWTRFQHGELSWSVDWRGVLESSDGSVWFAAAVDSADTKERRQGILQFRDGTWIHHHQPGRAPTHADDLQPATLLPATQRPEPVGKFLCLGESKDGKIWTGRNLLAFGDGRGWSTFSLPGGLRTGVIETMFTSREKDLWIGTRQFGAIRYDGRDWVRFQGEASLVANSVRGIAQASDGTIWVATDHGFARFDGHGWTADILPSQLDIPHEGGSLKATASGELWINRFAPDWPRRAWVKAPPADLATREFWTVRHHAAGAPPRTSILQGAKEVSHLGNLSVLWSGRAPWREAGDGRLQFSYRLDDGPWSAFAAEQGHAFFNLPSGPHRLEVRARDPGFNVDPTPAALDFVVQPPVWRQPWFLALMVLLFGAVATQSVRVFLERGRLRRANRVLADEVEERTRTQEEMRAANARHARQEAALLVLTRDCAQRPVCVADLLRDVTRVAAQTLQVGRVSVWRFTTDRRTLLCRALHPGAVGAAGGQAGAASLLADEHPAYFRALEEGAVGGAADASPGPCTRALSAIHPVPFEIGASLETPIQVSGGVAGLLCAEHAGAARRWTADEQTFALSIANLVSLLLVEEERQAIEDQLRQAQKLEAIGQLAGGVAHDFNNILTVIIMQADMAAMKEASPADVRDQLGEIRAAAERAANLTRQLLLFSRSGTMQPRDLNLNAAVTGIGKMLRRIIGEDVRLQLTLHPEPLVVRADAGMLDQVLLNLAVNARDAMPGGGTLGIEISVVNVGAELIRSHPDATPGRYACVSVTDTGTGIAPELLPRIFEPFFTTKEPGKGTGLGLATTFGIVKQHQGWITVDSECGRGTGIRVFLPLVPPAGESPEGETNGPDAPGGTGGTETILVVEDEFAVRTLARTVLQRAGYQVLEAANGVEALHVWETHGEGVALLFTDLVMPAGIDGRTLARRLRVVRPGLKVIYCSGYSDDPATRGPGFADGDHFLQKPFGPGRLLEIVRRCLDE